MALFPYPVLSLSLILFWLLLAGFTPGQMILAAAVSFGAAHALKALGEKTPRVRRWLAIPKLAGIVIYDIIRSNIAVARLLAQGNQRPQRSGFMVVPLRLRDPAALAVLAIVLTSTPGTAWLDFNSARGELLIHVFDLIEEDEWRDIICNRYEKLLLEIFA